MGDDFGQAVEEVSNYPIEHFDEEGKFLQDAAMDVVGEAGGVWSIHGQSAEFSSFWELFGGRDVILRIIIIVGVVPQQIFRGARGRGLVK